MVLKIEKKQPVGTMVVEKNGDKTEIIEKVGEPLLASEVMANVGLKVGMTKNLGNYESLRVDVSLYMPCEPKDEIIHETFDFVETWCDLKMQKIMDELQ